MFPNIYTAHVTITIIFELQIATFYAFITNIKPLHRFFFLRARVSLNFKNI